MLCNGFGGEASPQGKAKIEYEFAIPSFPDLKWKDIHSTPTALLQKISQHRLQGYSSAGRDRKSVV